MRQWFDSHLDLAYLAVHGREMHEDVLDSRTPFAPGSITLPSLEEGALKGVLGTIFTEADGKDVASYPAGDFEAAHQAALRQLAVYEKWRDEGRIYSLSSLDEKRGLALGILMEGADPIRSVDELPWWKERGVVAIGLSWWKASRYAGGNGTAIGLSDEGRSLIRAMESLDLVLDLSHLSDLATDQALDFTDRAVIASHSNCRSLLDGKTSRHLRDEVIKEVGSRGGVIGLNLVSPFLVHDPDFSLENIERCSRASIDACVAHIEKIVELHGHARGIGLGSDADGGVSANVLPLGISRPRDYNLIADALTARGWSDEDVERFCFGNWKRFWIERLRG